MNCLVRLADLPPSGLSCEWLQESSIAVQLYGKINLGVRVQKESGIPILVACIPQIDDFGVKMGEECLRNLS